MSLNDKNYLILISLTAILLIVSVIYLAGTTDVFAHRSNTDSEEIHIPTFETIPEQTVDCELCHIQPEELTKHINGGNYCAECHETEIHGIHISNTTTDVPCAACHGDTNNPTIPEKLPEQPTICDSCHAYPDGSQPSYGNLIVIHITRGYTCNLCHIQDIQTLHKSASLNKTTTR